MGVLVGQKPGQRRQRGQGRPRAEPRREHAGEKEREAGPEKATVRPAGHLPGGKARVRRRGRHEGFARDEGHDVVVAKFPFTANAKAHGVGDPSGFVKLIADANHGELLGGHLVGHDVSELLPELTLAQKWDLTASELARNVHTHPTMSEALQECFHGLIGHMINF